MHRAGKNELAQFFETQCNNLTPSIWYCTRNEGIQSECSKCILCNKILSEETRLNYRYTWKTNQSWLQLLNTARIWLHDLICYQKFWKCLQQNTTFIISYHSWAVSKKEIFLHTLQSSVLLLVTTELAYNNTHRNVVPISTFFPDTTITTYFILAQSLDLNIIFTLSL